LSKGIEAIILTYLPIEKVKNENDIHNAFEVSELLIDVPFL